MSLPASLAFSSQPFLHRDAEQDLDGLDSDGPARLRPEQESEAGVPMGEFT